jgi:hypothetical protein
VGAQAELRGLVGAGNHKARIETSGSSYDRMVVIDGEEDEGSHLREEASQGRTTNKEFPPVLERPFLRAEAAFCFSDRVAVLWGGDGTKVGVSNS